MEEKPVSLQSDEMRPVLAWKDAIEDNLPPAAGKEFASSWSSKRVKDPARVYGRMVAWQLEDPVYGLKNLASVRKDKDLLSFLEEISVMHKKEAQGMPVSQEEFQELGERVLEAWAFKGEQKKKERAAFARKWAWLGARKWAWISSRAWTRAWNWLIAATGPKRYSSATNLILAWSGAWKWPRIWESPWKRLDVLALRFLEEMEAPADRPAATD